MGIYKPLLKVHDRPLLYGNNRSLDASTYTNFKPCILMELAFPSQEHHLVKTPLKNTSQDGNLPQIGVNIKIFETTNQTNL